MIVPPGPDARERGGNLLVAAVLANEGAQIMALPGEQAQEELAFGRQAPARTAAAKGLGNTGDQSYFARLVGIAPAPRHFAVIARHDGFEGKLVGNTLQNLR